MKSYGYCTLNEDGLFEVHWENEETLFTKLLKKKTKFKFTTDEINKDNWTDFLRVYSTYNWCDEEGAKVDCDKILDKIDDVLSEMVYDRWKLEGVV